MANLIEDVVDVQDERLEGGHVSNGSEVLLPSSTAHHKYSRVQRSDFHNNILANNYSIYISCLLQLFCGILGTSTSCRSFECEPVLSLSLSLSLGMFVHL